jgi:biotin carboxyl carrier protein
MPGLVLRIDVKVGDAVKQNQAVMVMEAMKMENEIFAPSSGIITEIRVKQGDQLSADDVLLVIGGGASAPVAAPVQTAPAPAAAAVQPQAQSVASAPVQTTGTSAVKAPMPGLVLRINVKEGDSVNKNGLLLVMEAMKMENEIFAPVAGKVTKICVKQGDQLMADDVLAYIG